MMTPAVVSEGSDSDETEWGSHGYDSSLSDYGSLRSEDSDDDGSSCSLSKSEDECLAKHRGARGVGSIASQEAVARDSGC